jgi:regulator of replication initiation timing
MEQRQNEAIPDVRLLQKQLDLRDRQVEALKERLATASAENETLGRELRSLRERDAALGLEALTGDQRKIRDKLVAAVRDVNEAQQARKSMAQALAELLESARVMIGFAAALGPDAKAQAEERMTVAEVLLTQGVREVEPAAEQLLFARVLYADRKSGIVLINAGWAQGTEPGMTFDLSREGVALAQCRVVDVRESVSGALLSPQFAGTEVRRGDKARIQTRQVK